jgi:hypothetical protein
MRQALAGAGIMGLICWSAAGWAAVGKPGETTDSLDMLWSVTYLRESAALFPPSSVVRDLGDGRAITRLVRTRSPDGDPQGGLVRALEWLPDRSALMMKSSLWVEDERSSPRQRRIQMVSLDGTTTTTVGMTGGRTRTVTELAPLEPGGELLLDEVVAEGDLLPEDCLDLGKYRPYRFVGLTGGDAGCPMTAVHTYAGDNGGTTTLLADMGLRNLLSETTVYTTATIVETAQEPHAAGPGRFWPSKIIRQRLDLSGEVAQVTTFSLLRVAVTLPGQAESAGGR